MDHELAIQNQAVERYILGEMEPEEREAFEEHFFLCELCGGDVRATFAFAEEARAIFKERRPWPKPARSRFSWKIPSFAFAAAAALCLMVIGYQNFEVIPALKAPQPITSGVIFDGATRSAVPVLREGEALHFQMPWEQGGPAFVELRSGSKTLSSGTVAAPAKKQPLDVYFPGKLKPGRYNVVVRALKDGQPGQESIENEFEVIPQHP